MSELIKLELKRNSLKPYYFAAIASAIVMLGFIYLMAAIPGMDPGDSDAELFGSYKFIIGLTMAVMMGIFSIMSAVMAARFVVDEYSGKKAILLFSYPISRERILTAKILLVSLYTFFSMLIGGTAISGVFMVTERFFPLCSTDTVNIGIVLWSVGNIVFCGLISAFCGVLSLWIGFIKKSVIVTIVASCIIMVVICQIVTMSLFSNRLMILILFIAAFFTIAAVNSLRNQVRKMEI